MKLKTKIGSVLSLIFPSQKAEFILFTLFLVSYGILGSIIAWDYRIIFDNRIPWDAYFSFDNRAIVMTGGGFERHPLSNYFFDFIRNFALVFSEGEYNEVFRLVLAWCSNLTISLSLIQIYKYLRNIIGLPIKLSVLLVIFFLLFSLPISYFLSPLKLILTPYFYCVGSIIIQLKNSKMESLFLLRHLLFRA